jgi:hypothetical protein
MERHETTMRAARYLLGAGTFAAMLAMTGSASAQTSVCYGGGEGDPRTFCGHVFTDIGDDDDMWNSTEGVENVDVAITNASGENVSNSPIPSSACAAPGDCSEFGGYYEFQVPAETTTGAIFWICLVTDLDMDGVVEDAEKDCRQNPDAVQVTVGTSPPFVDFEVGDDGSEDPDPSDIWGVGTGTPGYWKNHWEAWPQAGITVGGVNYLNQTTPATPPDKTIYDAIKLMGKVGGDKTVSMFAALISAKLNATLENNTACIADTIAKADLWMAAHPVGSGVKASSPAWVEADAWHTLLDDYNNGKLCAPHRN